MIFTLCPGIRNVDQSPSPRGRWALCIGGRCANTPSLGLSQHVGSFLGLSGRDVSGRLSWLKCVRSSCLEAQAELWADTYGKFGVSNLFSRKRSILVLREFEAHTAFHHHSALGFYR
jgi:hypothetical protein